MEPAKFVKEQQEWADKIEKILPERGSPALVAALLGMAGYVAMNITPLPPGSDVEKEIDHLANILTSAWMAWTQEQMHRWQQERN